jgi:threonine/homoserine/homoserine lactone efflux protein
VTEGLLGFILAGLALAGSPGPATLSLAATGAAFGGRHGLGYMTGIDIGMLVVLVVTASGVTGVLLALPGAAPVIALLSTAYFLYLAFRIATAPPLSENADEQARPSFVAGLFLSLVNPKGYAAMAAMFSGFVLLRERLVLDLALKTGVLLAIIAAVNGAWLFVGAALTRCFREPRVNRIINVAFAILLIASVALVFVL